MAKKFFIPLRKLFNFFLELDVDELAFFVSNQNEFKDLVIELNTQKQLFDKGQDSTGKSLGEYRPFTVREKRRKGQPTDRVTLKDTGDFYESFNVQPFFGGFIIDADAEKDDKDLRDVYGEDIIGLNDENLQIIIDYYLDAFKEEIRKRYKAA
jgi:hypothetical protein